MITSNFYEIFLEILSYLLLYTIYIYIYININILPMTFDVIELYFLLCNMRNMCMIILLHKICTIFSISSFYFLFLLTFWFYYYSISSFGYILRIFPSYKFFPFLLLIFIIPFPLIYLQNFASDALFS